MIAVLSFPYSDSESSVVYFSVFLSGGPPPVT